MKTAKDKAQELLEKFAHELPSEYLHYDQIQRFAIECAKISVDEIIETLKPIHAGYDILDEIQYWQEVKNELNKML